MSLNIPKSEKESPEPWWPTSTLGLASPAMILSLTSVCDPPIAEGRPELQAPSVNLHDTGDDSVYKENVMKARN
jgi:hypothetical protein